MNIMEIIGVFVVLAAIIVSLGYILSDIANKDGNEEDES